MLEALKVFWRILTESGEGRTWFPHTDGKRMCRWKISSVTNMNSSPYLAKSCTIRSASR